MFQQEQNQVPILNDAPSLWAQRNLQNMQNKQYSAQIDNEDECGFFKEQFKMKKQTGWCKKSKTEQNEITSLNS